MQKSLTYALLLAATLGLTACGDKREEEKTAPASGTPAPATQPMDTPSQPPAVTPPPAPQPQPTPGEADKPIEEQKQQ